MSLFDHLHDCYVECTQNSADKSSDKVYTYCTRSQAWLQLSHCTHIISTSAKLCSCQVNVDGIFDSSGWIYDRNVTWAPHSIGHIGHNIVSITLSTWYKVIWKLWKTKFTVNESMNHTWTCTHTHTAQRFRSAVNLLQRVPPEHARPSLIVNLRSDEEGYSFMLCPSDGECFNSPHAQA